MTNINEFNAVPPLRTYTVPEAGAMIGLKKNTAYEAAKRGQIPTIRIGGLLRVPRKLWDAIVDGDRAAEQIPNNAN